MCARSSCLFLSLLASLWAIGVAPATADPVFHTHKVGLALPSSPVSAIPIDATALAEQICDENPSKWGGGPLVMCQATVKHLKEMATGPDASASALRLVSAKPVVTSCGLWDATLTLDPIRLRPVSQKGSRRGVSALILEMKTNLHLANRKTGQTADFALLPGSGPAGRWVLAPTGERPNLILADESDDDDDVISFEGCIPAWVYKDPSFTVIPKDGCEACPDDQSSD